MRLRSVSRAAGFVLAGLAALGGAPGCEFIVKDSLPSTIACTGTAATDCPTGQTCKDGVCTECGPEGCFPLIVDAGHDARKHPDAHVVDTGHDVKKPVDVRHDTAPPADVASDTGPGGGAIGASCTDNGSCATGLGCTPTVDLPGLTFTVTSVCSRPCCADDDCGQSNVCYPTAGGNFCITARAAEACGTSCGTSCCHDSDCGSTGKVFCAAGSTFAGTGVPSCQTFTGDTACTLGPCKGTAGDECGVDTDCEHGVCQSSASYGGSCGGYGAGCTCLGPVTCCSNSDCTEHGTTCEWLEATDATNNPVVLRGCQAPGGTTATGGTCTTDDACSGGVCGQFVGQKTMQCTQPCCEDADCESAGSGWVCRPLNVKLTLGSVPLLVCQPPSP
jgi:hypothetical protein